MRSLQPPFHKPDRPKALCHASKDTSFQPFHLLCCLSVHTYKDLHIFLKWWGPEVHTAPTEAASVLRTVLCSRVILFSDQLVTAFDRAQDVLCSLGCQSTLLSPELLSTSTPEQNLAFRLVKLIMAQCSNLSRPLCFFQCLIYIPRKTHIYSKSSLILPAKHLCYFKLLFFFLSKYWIWNKQGLYELYKKYLKKIPNSRQAWQVWSAVWFGRGK